MGCHTVVFEEYRDNFPKSLSATCKASLNVTESRRILHYRELESPYAAVIWIQNSIKNRKRCNYVFPPAIPQLHSSVQSGTRYSVLQEQGLKSHRPQSESLFGLRYPHPLQMNIQLISRYVSELRGPSSSTIIR